MRYLDNYERDVLRAAFDHGNALNAGSAEIPQMRIAWDTACVNYAAAHERFRIAHNAQSRPVDAEPMDTRVKEALLELQAVEVPVVEALAWRPEPGDEG